MAEVSKKSFKTKKKTPDNLTCELVFDGGLLSNTRASLVIELIKYFMFERHQIPQPFEHVKRDMKMKEEKIAAGPRTQPTDLQPKRKIKSIIENLEMLFDNLEKSFVLCPEISQIVIILGGTIVSPKETFVIKLPQLSPDADNLVFKTCVKAMFRQIITQDLLCDMKALTPTNMSVLLHAPRECNMEWFIPNHTFKFPVRGRFFTYNCTCKQPVDDRIWFQSPVNVKGFRDPLNIQNMSLMFCINICI
ncbi:hypothetical protein LOTGIDRAFT_111103 [Lottia gigantea]|uniref:MAD2L1-binding protein n=1 Tax=Lottia gigantea TaxID=225164 RepID=V4B5M0_LOTGI|nr:hypothetical protein LOTGIDRAFT_111103 [Lottia gigantea]ESP02826.1 hypothetical protein LOTGIDRAFT_111103 [Lottia gigantea]